MTKVCSWIGQDFNAPLKQKLQPWSMYWVYMTPACFSQHVKTPVTYQAAKSIWNLCRMPFSRTLKMSTPGQGHAGWVYPQGAINFCGLVLTENPWGTWSCPVVAGSRSHSKSTNISHPPLNNTLHGHKVPVACSAASASASNLLFTSLKTAAFRQCNFLQFPLLLHLRKPWVCVQVITQKVLDGLRPKKEGAFPRETCILNLPGKGDSSKYWKPTVRISIMIGITDKGTAECFHTSTGVLDPHLQSLCCHKWWCA